jgi:hypothetical protein
VYDSNHDRVITLGYPVVYSLAFDLGSSTWQAIDAQSVPFNRDAYSVIYDPVRDRVVIHGGFDQYHYPPVVLDETWELWLRSPAVWTDLSGGLAAVSSQPTETVALYAVVPNPTRRAMSVDFTLSREAHARLTVLDLAGRVVAVPADEIFPPGRHHVTWSGLTIRGPAPAGLYFVRLDSDGRRLSRRAVIAP